MVGDIWLLERSQGRLSEGLLESVVIVYFDPRDVDTHLRVLLTTELDAVPQEPQGQHQSATQDHLIHTCNNKLINNMQVTNIYMPFLLHITFTFALSFTNK